MCLAFHPEGSASPIAVRPSIRLGTANLIGKHCWSARIRTMANGAICDRTLVIRPGAPALARFICSSSLSVHCRPVRELFTRTEGRPIVIVAGAREETYTVATDPAYCNSSNTYRAHGHLSRSRVCSGNGRARPWCRSTWKPAIFPFVPACCGAVDAQCTMTVSEPQLREGEADEFPRRCA